MHIDWISEKTGFQDVDGSYTVRMFDSDESAEAEFNVKVAEAIANGWTETERSLSRRVFVEAEKGKVWMIELDGDQYTVRFGKDPRGRTADPGNFLRNERTTQFDSPEKARKGYHKVIDAKLREGYQEFRPRPTK